ncbi:flavin reductase family protein [Herbiconiux sp. KACC 21604]|uniref:flavin reductase family protein n=1 Tax=unclassified Herbiconiux TaxID=2618217 RepID=UPI00149312FC|nr:flavin reductase family protein [Herbiconiux sp. SALV-R1]QJU55630.1 flavin reductase [Herbiconiux sp. SALV-R1]WPO86827.1 flavin reductase family protein [Herbiconiux sp. KACC 21604]
MTTTDHDDTPGIADGRLVDELSTSTLLSAEEFKAAFRNHPAGVAVITADPGDGPVALTATSVFSVSATPPLLVFSVSELSSAAPAITRSTSVVVHLLGADQLGLARLCATSGVDRFAGGWAWERLGTGEPRFLAAPDWIRGTVVTTLQAGTSTLVVVNATHSSGSADESDRTDGRGARPLVYHNRTWHELSERSAV